EEEIAPRGRARQVLVAAVRIVAGRRGSERAVRADREPIAPSIEDMDAEIDRRVAAADLAEKRRVAATLARRDRRGRKRDDAGLELGDGVRPIDDARERIGCGFGLRSIGG